MSWPDRKNRIATIRFRLMTGFDSHGQPVYVNGTVDSAEELQEVQSLLEPMRPYPHTITSVTMGEVTLELEDGGSVTLQPVFHPSRDRYGDLFFVPDSQSQYAMPPRFAELLERWRTTPRESPPSRTDPAS